MLLHLILNVYIKVAVGGLHALRACESIVRVLAAP